MVRLSPPDKIGEFFGIYGLVGKGSQVVGQLLYGIILFLLLDRFGNGAYQVAVLSLLVTMLIGLWLIWPVRDDWAGSGETSLPETMGPVAPPERLAPARRPARASLRLLAGKRDFILTGDPHRRQPAQARCGG